MASSVSQSSFAFICYFLLFLGMASAQLTANFYDRTCPCAQEIIRNRISVVVSSCQLNVAWGHPCFVFISMIALLMQGCDASVLLDAPAGEGEKDALPNLNSLRGFGVIDTLKAELEAECRGVVSCADILALAARDSVVQLGGRPWNVLLGRRDSTTASFQAASTELPHFALDLDQLIIQFNNKNFTQEEMVALTGAHEIGQASCFTFRDRIYNEDNIDPTFAASLQVNCGRDPGDRDSNPAPLDSTTPNVFDNAFFRGLMNRRGLLKTDQELYRAGRRGQTDVQVERYFQNSGAFFVDFNNAMVKMANLSPLTATQGQVRANCRRVNN